MHSTRVLLAMLCCLLPVMASAQETVPPPTLRGLGVCTHLARPGWEVEKLVPILKRMGVSVVRDEISWASVEKKRGQYALPPASEKWIRALEKVGIQVILVLDYGNTLYKTPEDPAGLDPDAFARYAAWMASHFKGRNRIAAYEIWNEPNNFAFRKTYGGEWNGKDNAPWVAKFATLVQKSAAAIKAVDADTPVITGCGVPPATLHLLKRYPQALAQVDGLTDHPYGFRLPSESVPWGGEETAKRDGVSVADPDHSLLSLLDTQRQAAREALGRPVPLYITEVGYSTYRRQRRPAMYAGFTEQAQAAYHARSLLLGLSAGARYWCLYDLLNDGSDPTEAEQNFGLVRRDFTPKLAALAVERVARLLGEKWEALQTPPGTFALPWADAKDGAEWAAANAPRRETSPRVTGPQTLWFKTPEGVVAFVWRAGRLDTETNPPLATLALTTPGATLAAVTHLVSGHTRSVSFLSGQPAEVKNVEVGSEPIAIFWRTGASRQKSGTKHGQYTMQRNVAPAG